MTPTMVKQYLRHKIATDDKIGIIDDVWKIV